ncbi:GspE/PulE family protein [Bovifimicola ammoniilytica]|jgi:Type II secretory pathway, ATPase PulE/Tfp pilus assembly pathway, ATPase PilB|uniref:GspE/PulE family protein n=1 Tax=Bovifimicola ammoniilytica TaxID=2981720 RepID=UPI00033EFF87|nr:ATPase, T2SS/T4P/T4SS family [Bovifimicola ammoniilytica]MCU6753180.1 ATPase, T2SS/T4P/T4SS family [Bovifimicola ammoniilytica]CCZ05345.1 type II/IV secretion system protein [Eubacterium sp. CAG:603]SCJ56381.1 Type II traffic warden ATPase [uncultured Eubacterium sp.]
MARYNKIRLGDCLVQKGMITEEQLSEALVKQKENGTKLGETIVELGYVSENDMIDVLVEQLGIEYVDVRKIKVDENAARLLKEDFMRKNSLIPIAFDELLPNVIRVAMADPMDIIAIDDISIITNMQVDPVLSTKGQINMAIDKIFGATQAMQAAEQYRKERERDREKAGLNMDEEEEDSELDNSPIVQLVRSILEQGVRRRASDIHIEALEFQVRVRFRIDGALVQVMTYDIDLLPAIVARIKIIGGMDISEKRKPQDGRIAMTVDRRDYDVRVSILPTINGEKVVMRLTSKENLTRDKKNLGFSEEELEKFDRILKNPHGIILVTGPTGSGKSTTLYTALSELNTEDVNIITVEDPVEANMEGINQVHVNEKAGLTFASALRSILRQDPDIIMIGEIRDGETAGIAVKAAITGHLVVSTLHTNGTASTVTRLVDMGMESYLIGDALVGVIAQRLVRRLCPECKRLVYATEDEKRLLGVTTPGDLPIYEPVGCEACGNTGYHGRIGVYEIMPVTNDLRIKIAAGARADEIKEQAVSEGMSTLSVSAAKLCVQGVTSFKEALKIAYESE